MQDFAVGLTVAVMVVVYAAFVPPLVIAATVLAAVGFWLGWRS